MWQETYTLESVVLVKQIHRFVDARPHLIRRHIWLEGCWNWERRKENKTPLEEKERSFAFATSFYLLQAYDTILILLGLSHEKKHSNSAGDHTEIKLQIRKLLFARSLAVIFLFLACPSTKRLIVPCRDLLMFVKQSDYGWQFSKWDPIKNVFKRVRFRQFFTSGSSPNQCQKHGEMALKSVERITQRALDFINEKQNLQIPQWCNIKAEFWTKEREVARISFLGSVSLIRLSKLILKKWICVVCGKY